jgi:hypothetical protein
VGHLGLKLLSGVVRDQSFSDMDARGLLDTVLFDEAREGLKFCRDFIVEYGSWPSKTVVEERLGVDLPECDSPTPYVAELVRKRWISSELEKSLTSAIQKIEHRDPDAALDQLTRLSSDLKAVSSRNPIVSYRDSGESRFDDYLVARDSGGVIGIRTPWDKLNDGIQGWVDGSFNVVAAMSNTGKTWMLCVCADHAERVAGKKVLFVTMEMSSTRISRRLDAVRYKIPFGALRDCSLDPIEEKEWEENLKDLKKDSEKSDIYIADKKAVRTVTDVFNLVQEIKPDIVFIDGGYRFESDKGAGQWEQTLNVVTDLQVYAEKSNIPWVVTTQFGDSNETGKKKKKGDHVRAWNVRYGKEWLIHPDVLIGLFADEDLRLIKSMEIHVLKVRDADKMFDMFQIEWDMGKMSFVESSHEDAGDFDADDFDSVVEF